MENENTTELLTIELAPDVHMEFMPVPVGKFIMGSDKNKDEGARNDELPQHKVTLSAYWIGKYPVPTFSTRLLYRRKALTRQSIGKMV